MSVEQTRLFRAVSWVVARTRVYFVIVFALLGAELGSLLVEPEYQGLGYAVGGATSAVLYWTLWGWVQRLARQLGG